MTTTENSASPWHSHAHRHPSAFLLAAQVLSLVLYAVFEGSPSGRAVLGTFGIMVLSLVVWVIKSSPRLRWITWILVVPTFLLSSASVLIDDPNLLFWAAVLEAALYFYAAGCLIAYMLEDVWVTSDELFAAGATFTLIAWGFAYAYLACQTWLPGSFSGATFSGKPEHFLELLYLSINNLSSAGLGDIVPVKAPARVLVMLEQVAGVGYITVVVSRLIGMTILRRRRSKRDRLS
ncbi:MAG: two pore domain potassium channel family protein [Blastocatellia bacterium]|nr:two pore domain potassium channel family protein [Blastocatellia bacterium]